MDARRTERIEALIARGAAAHPTLAVSREAWTSFFAEHLRPPDSDTELALDVQLDTLFADDVHLILACLAGSPQAHARLDTRILATHAQAMAGKRLSPEDRDEVLQTVRAKLFVGSQGRGKIAGYSGRGPLDGWLRVASSNEAISKLRAHAAVDNRTSDEEAIDLAGKDDPEIAILRGRYGTELKKALEESLAALDPSDRKLVREHYVEGLTIDDLAAVYDTHRATAARRLARARNKIFEGGRRRLMTSLGLGDTEFKSLLGALVSGLDWTITAALDGARGSDDAAESGATVRANPENEEPSFAELGMGVVVAQRFELTRFLGAGATAVVWEARSLASASASVALKFSRSNAAEFALRFAREAEIAMAFVHPNVVRTFEVLSAVPGRGPCLVQELVRGETVEAILSEDALSVAEAAAIALPVAEALIAAHARGIVHRDLKPQNVMVTRASDPTNPAHPAQARVVVLDFGIAKLLASYGEHARLTRSGAIIGTPRYMAPEQIASERDIDARADIWSFGALLFHLLAGRPPIEAATPGEVYKALQRGQLPLLESTASHVPKYICTLVQSALTVERAKRLASLEPFVTALRPYAF